MKRPVSVTILSVIFAGSGAIALAYHAMDFKPSHPLAPDLIRVSLASLAAVVGGIFMFRGHNWARWLAVVWMAFHVVISTFHNLAALTVHILLLALFAYLLFRPRAAEYFRP